MSPAETRAIALLSLAGFASGVAIRMCDPLLPQLAQDFATTPGTAARVVSGFSVAYGLMLLVYGPLGDRFGKYRVISIATLACAIVSLGAAMASSLSWLVLSRVIAGATTAAIVPLSMAWIGDTVSYTERQVTLARFLTGTITGMAGGQFIGGFFADHLGWRWAFIILALIYLVVGGLLLAELKRQAVFRSREAQLPTSDAKPKFTAQTATVVKDRWAQIIFLTVFLEGMVIYGSLAFVPTYLHARFQVSLTGAGAIVAAFALGGLVYTFLARRLVTQLGERGLAQGGGLVVGIAYMSLLFGTAWFWALPAIFGIGLGFYMLHNTLQTNATQMAPTARGTAVSLFASALFLGQSAGAAMGAVLVDEAGPAWLFGISALAIPLIGFGFARALRGRQKEALVTDVV